MLARATMLRVRYLGLGVLAAGLLLAAGASAAPRQTTPANAQAITQLKAARTLLNNAKHDYDGHRAKAVHEVTKAIHALEGTHGRQAAHLGKSKGNKNEPQSVSDALLQQALQQLKAVQKQLGSSNTGDVTVASAAITRAISDVETALSIK